MRGGAGAAILALPAGSVDHLQPGGAGRTVLPVTPGAITHALKPIVDFVYPPRCPLCGGGLAEQGGLCLDCWQTLELPGSDGCARCGVPGEDAVCHVCRAAPPQHRGIAAATWYGETSRQLVLKFKHGRRLALARPMARMIARQLPQDVGKRLLVPVPLHRQRLWHRGFNQSALMADHLGRLTGWPVDRHGLRRVRRTQPLRGMNPAQRARAVRGAFALAPGHGFAGRRVLLIDDVRTSGATAAACARMLKRGGATNVRLLCWARALPDRDATLSRGPD